MDAAITPSAIIYYTKLNKENRSICGYAKSADTETQMMKTSAKIVEATTTNRLTMPLMMKSNTKRIADKSHNRTSQMRTRFSSNFGLY